MPWDPSAWHPRPYRAGRGLCAWHFWVHPRSTELETRGHAQG